MFLVNIANTLTYIKTIFSQHKFRGNVWVTFITISKKGSMKTCSEFITGFSLIVIFSRLEMKHKSRLCIRILMVKNLLSWKYSFIVFYFV